MNPEMTSERPVWHVGLGFVVASLLFGALVLIVECSTPPPAIDADRACYDRSRHGDTDEY